MPNKFGSIECPRCGKSVELTPYTTTVTLYDWPRPCPYQHLYVICNRKGCVFAALYFADIEEMQRAIKAGCAVQISAYPDDVTIEIWWTTYGPEPQTYTLTPRLEAEIERLRNFLDNCPDELTYGFLTGEPPDSSMPERWQ